MCAPRVSRFICYSKPDLSEDGHKCVPVHKPVISAITHSTEYDVEALIMDASSSWKGGKALIYTHRLPGIFVGLAKCHYTAGGEVMKCNKL